jgi:hypothetical protein
MLASFRDAVWAGARENVSEETGWVP